MQLHFYITLTTFVIFFDYICNMKTVLDKYKGIHPGLILEHELKKRQIPKIRLAEAVHQKRQIINDITKGRRKLPLELAFKIDKELGLTEGTMLMMQTYFEIENHRIKANKPDNTELIAHLRPGLFWDTDITKLDRNKNASAIIRRVFDRGNNEEKKFIIAQYNKERVKKVLGQDPNLLLADNSK